MAPVNVAWSMLVGAVLCWGLIWPVVWSREGIWYPAKLSEWDPRGRYGYQLWVVGGLLVAEGLFQIISGLVAVVWGGCSPDTDDDDDDDDDLSNEDQQRGGGYGGGWGRKSGMGYHDNDHMIREGSPDGSVMIDPQQQHGGGWGRKTTAAGSSSYGGGDYRADEVQYQIAQQREVRVAVRNSSSSGGRSSGSHSVRPPVKKSHRKKKTLKHLWRQEMLRTMESDALSDASTLQFGLAGVEAALRRFIFLDDHTPAWVGWVGYIILLGLAVAVVPALAKFSGVAYYHILAVGGMAAVLAIGNMVAAGLTDLSLTDTCLKLIVLLMAVWGSSSGGGGAMVGLVSGGWALGVLASANCMMYAYTTGYVTMANPTAVMSAYAFGASFGCIIAPFTLWLYAHVPSVAVAPAVGAPGLGLVSMENGLPAHMAPMMLALAEAGNLGFKSFGRNTIWFGVGAFAAGMVLRALAAALPGRTMKAFVPKPAAVAALAVLGANTAVGVALGCLVKLMWRWRYPRSAEAYAWVVGAALIAGEGVWALGNGLLMAFKIKPPICMSFSIDG